MAIDQQQHTRDIQRAAADEDKQGEQGRRTGALDIALDEPVEADEGSDSDHGHP